MNITMPDVIGDNKHASPARLVVEAAAATGAGNLTRRDERAPARRVPREFADTPPPPLKKTLTSRDFCCSYGRRIAPHLIHTPTPPKTRP